MAVAFAIAIAIHEIIAGLIPNATPTPRTEPEIVAHIQIARITRRLPTPTPPPPPVPPRVISHARIVAPTETRTIARTTSGTSAHREVIHRMGAARPKPPKFSNTKPIWDIPVGAQGAGAGKASGAGSIGNGGNGTGAGNAGSGNGAAAGNEPCGFVDFVDPHGSRYDAQTHGFWVDVQISVHYADGHTDSIMLDYPFYYPNEASNPWSDQNLKDPNFLPRFQPPPPDRRDAEPPIVQYVMQHSDKAGFTLLKDCPTASPNP